MADVDTRIDSLKEDIREIGYTVLDLQAKALAHDSKLEQVLATQLAHDARFDAVDGRFDAVDGRLDAVDGRLGAVDGRLGSIDTELGAINTRFDTTDARFDQVDALLAEVLSRQPQPPQ